MNTPPYFHEYDDPAEAFAAWEEWRAIQESAEPELTERELAELEEEWADQRIAIGPGPAFTEPTEQDAAWWVEQLRREG